MSHDIFGKGQFVQHAVVQNERRTTLLTVLEEFKRNNPWWRRIHCILIDKDFTEISVLKVAFPDARLLLCQFHISVREYHVPTMVSCPGRNSSGIVNMLVYVRTEREFKKYRGYLNYIMNIGRSAEGVVSQLRFGDSQLGTGTTELGIGSGIEASWKQLKYLVNSFMCVDECVVSIMCYQDQEEKKFMSCLYKLSVVHNPKQDRKMQFISNLVSKHACELIYHQFTYAITRAKYKYCEPVPNMCLLQHDIDEEDVLDEPRCEYSVTKRDWSCSCYFTSSRLLPCHHVFFLRKSLGCENIIPTQLLNPR
ncbi:unnamed protein product [Phytophthora fragariaefolia]|uniref:Unnamed protein product n=1 Tax=Phytophthora fragariaefolia TaxID=1490495 RepID=A0A9W7D081_9STRA|nr:unnamed protein product [Phytophthora fragariaefolia]